MSLNRKPFMTSVNARERSVNPEEVNGELLSVLRVIDGCENQLTLSPGEKFVQALRTLTGYEKKLPIANGVYINDDELKENRLATLDKASKSENLYLGRLATQKLRELGDSVDFDRINES